MTQARTIIREYRRLRRTGYYLRLEAIGLAVYRAEFHRRFGGWPR